MPDTGRKDPNQTTPERTEPEQREGAGGAQQASVGKEQDAGREPQAQRPPKGGTEREQQDVKPTGAAEQPEQDIDVEQGEIPGRDPQGQADPRQMDRGKPGMDRGRDRDR